jgi:hypothetical protein
MLASNLSAAGVVAEFDALDGIRESPGVYWERRSGLDWN